MALTEIDQLKQLVAAHQYFLIVWPPDDRGDALGSAWALQRYLESLGKHVELSASGFTAPPEWRHLDGVEKIKPRLAEIQKFILKVDVSKAPLETLSYDIKDGWLSVYLTPKHGVLTKNELRTASSTFKYQIVITVGANDLSALGEIFFNNTDLFYRLPVVALGTSTAHERFGAVNWIDLTASCLTELTARLLGKLSSPPFDQLLATGLLSGLVAATQRFTSPTVTPATLRLASDLVAAGADHERVITNLYRTRSLPTLKLWGAALAHLNIDQGSGLVCTTLAREDFTRAGATAANLNGIVEELLSTAPEAKLVLVLYETVLDANPVVQGMLVTGRHADALELAKALHPTGTAHQAQFSVAGKSLGEAESWVRSVLKPAKR